MRMRLTSALAFALLVPAALACTTGTETPDTVTITVDRNGGRVGPGGPLGELDIARGFVDAEAHFDGRYYLADRPLSDGPEDTQYRQFTRRVPGTMRVVSSTEVVFRDRHGHLALFRVRPGATHYRWCHPD